MNKNFGSVTVDFQNSRQLRVRAGAYKSRWFFVHQKNVGYGVSTMQDDGSLFDTSDWHRSISSAQISAIRRGIRQVRDYLPEDNLDNLDTLIALDTMESMLV